MNDKPHYRHVAGRWLLAHRPTKPRLRLWTDGRLSLSCAATTPVWDDDEARQFIRRHYGTFLAFGKRWQLSPGTVAAALPYCGRGNTAGKTRQLRLMLGLQSNPTQFGVICALAQKRRRESERGAAPVGESN